MPIYTVTCYRSSQIEWEKTATSKIQIETLMDECYNIPGCSPKVYPPYSLINENILSELSEYIDKTIKTNDFDKILGIDLYSKRIYRIKKINASKVGFKIDSEKKSGKIVAYKITKA